MQVSINLNNRTESPWVNIDLQWDIKITEPKQGWLPRLFRSQNRVNRRVRLSIDNISIDPQLECDPGNLFGVIYANRLYEQKDMPMEIEMTDMDTTFQLLLHQAAITDCNVAQDGSPRILPISFTLKVTDTNGRTIDSLTEQLQIVMEPLGVEPQFTIALDDDRIQYSSLLADECVGTFAAWIDEEFRYTPAHHAKVSMRLLRQGHEVERAVTFGPSGSPECEFDILPSRANAVTRPVHIDFSRLSNPTDPTQSLVIETTTRISPHHSPHLCKTLLQQTHITLLKDEQGTELKAYIQLPESEPVEVDTDLRRLPHAQFCFVPRSRMQSAITLLLTNLATDRSTPGAGLHIRNLSVAAAISGTEHLLTEQETLLPAADTIRIDGAAVEAMSGPQGLFIANGPDARTQLSVTFSPRLIADITPATPDYRFSLRAEVTFDYWEDKSGTADLSEATRRQARIPLQWDLTLLPNPEWLCIDYGSSAIVCRYDQATLGLNTRRKNIFREERDGEFALTKEETATDFLDSDIILRKNTGTEATSLCSQLHPDDTKTHYLSLGVVLSPSRKLIKDSVQHQIPCLKILVGNETLPHNPDYLGFEYGRIDTDGRLSRTTAQQALERREPTCLLYVSSVFREAYAALFRYFILPETEGKRINKLVLTYPNTYTPAHLRTLQRIATDTFPRLRPGYLRFVSESDAVATYYINHWDHHNPGGNIRADETVLVYDMGAGTLDLTLFTKKADPQGKLQVSILGKIGTGKAGNYLDFLLAKIVTDSVPRTKAGDHIVSTDRAHDTESLVSRLDIKQKIKDQIKPNLRPDTTLHFNRTEFDSGIILGHPLFEEFITDVTDSIINRLMNFLADPAIQIDTVVMSGRSTRLQPLQTAMRATLNRLSKGHTRRTRIVKLSGPGDLEKTSVVQGAMTAASIYSQPDSPVVIRSRRLYASYGVVYKKIGGSYRYVPLLEASQMPFETDMTNLAEFDGPTVTLKGTAASDRLHLIQTYLTPAQTEQAYNSGDFEFISEMEQHDMANFGHRDSLNVRLHLNYRNDVQLYVDGSIGIGAAPKGVDLKSEITRKSIWPVTI